MTRSLPTVSSIIKILSETTYDSIIHYRLWCLSEFIMPVYISTLSLFICLKKKEKLKNIPALLQTKETGAVKEVNIQSR